MIMHTSVRRMTAKLTALSMIAIGIGVVSAAPALACTAGTLWEDFRAPDGTWSGFNAIPEPSGGAGDISDAYLADGSYHIDSIDSNGLEDNVRYTNGSWQGWEKPQQPPATPERVEDAAMPDGSMQMLVYTSNGLYHNIRYSDGLWQGWVKTTQPFTDYSSFGDIAATGISNGGMVVVVDRYGTWYRNERYASGSWSGWSTVAGGWGSLTVAGDNAGNVQFMGLDGTGAVYHNIMYANGSWQGWRGTEPPSIGTAQGDWIDVGAKAAGMNDGSVQFVAFGYDGEGRPIIYHNIRYADGTWQGWKQYLGVSGPNQGYVQVATFAMTGAEWGNSSYTLVMHEASVC
jgi:hypothetical protein